MQEVEKVSLVNLYNKSGKLKIFDLTKQRWLGKGFLYPLNFFIVPTIVM